MNTLSLFTISVSETLSPELLALGITWAMVLVGFEGMRRVRCGRDVRHLWRPLR